MQSAEHRDVTQVVVIACNQVALIERQQRLLRHYAREEFQYVVVDNSTYAGARTQLAALAAHTQSHYLPVPPCPRPDLGGSYAHGFAINFALQHLPLPPSRLLLLDHDIFPFQPWSVTRLLGPCFWAGVKQERGDRWYWWPGLLLADLRRVDHQRLDFLPGNGLDTGGGNQPHLQTFPRDQLRFFAHHDYSLPALREHPRAPLDSATSPPAPLAPAARDHYARTDALVETFGSWIHFFNGSDWKHTGDKTPTILHLLDHLTAPAPAPAPQ